MKYKNIMAICTAAISINSYACNIDVSSNSAIVKSTINKPFAYTKSLDEKKYQTICNKLNAENIAISVSGNAKIFDGALVMWTIVGLKDKKSDIISLDYAGTAELIAPPTMNGADDLMNQLISEALGNANINEAINSLNQKRRKIKS